jgi:glycerol kinase
MKVLGFGSSPLSSSFPHPGHVEHDADEITSSALGAVAAAMAQAGVFWSDIAGIGLAAQTETFVVWERATGRPVYPAISWRDGRADGLCKRLRAAGHAREVRRRTGLPLQPAFSASKLRWLLDHVDSGQRRADAGDLLFGDVNCWLAWNLSGGTAHVTDPSMAARTMLFSLADLAWDSEMLGMFRIPEKMLPEVRLTVSRLAVTDPAVCGGRATMSAAIGDQQAALFGQRCWEAGLAKLTLGTGAFLWCHAGPSPVTALPDGVVSSCAWQLAEGPAYALEGFVPNAGAVAVWLRRLGLLGAEDWPVIRSGALEQAAQSGGAGLWCVPALSGLGTPYWSAAVHADIFGLTANSTADDLNEATLLGAAHQVADATDALREGLDAPLRVIRVDGGMSRNDSLLQALADLCGAALERPRAAEATALGAGALAGLGGGLWDGESLDQMLSAAAAPAATIEPRLSPESRRQVRRSWQAVLERSLASCGAGEEPQ